MKFSFFKKLKNKRYKITGECSFCKKEFSRTIIINTNIENRKSITKRHKDKGAVFIWNTPGLTIKDVEDYLNGKDLYQIKYISKMLVRLKKIEGLRVNFGFPKLMLACEKCFRKEIKNDL